jgi:rhodanese-related sulfurtransferase
MSDQTPEISLEAYAAERETGVTIDVRERVEYAQSHVPGAVLIPMGQLASRLDEIDRSARVHVICASGNRSRAMADLLVAAGFDAASVAGGTRGWLESGRDLEVGSGVGR